MDALKLYKDPEPYFRGFISEIGFKRAEIEFVQPPRKHGRSKHNFFTLYGVAMTGFVNHSKLPLRLATFSGFFLAGGQPAGRRSGTSSTSWCSGTPSRWGWHRWSSGLFFFSAVQLIFIGIIGEYVGAILTQVKNRPLAIEDEKINFDDSPPGRASEDDSIGED